MLRRHFLLVLEQWWVIALGLCTVLVGLVYVMFADALSAQSLVDRPRTAYIGGAAAIAWGIVMIVVEWIPPVTRFRQARFGMQNLALHHHATFLIGVLSPMLTTAVVVGSFAMVIAGATPRSAAANVPIGVLMTIAAGFALGLLLPISVWNRGRELKHRRATNLCEVCAYPLSEDIRQCSECGKVWPKPAALENSR